MRLHETALNAYKNNLVYCIHSYTRLMQNLCRYFAVSSSKPDHRTVAGYALLFLGHSRLIVAVNGRSNVDHVAVSHRAVDAAVLCPVAALNRTLKEQQHQRSTWTPIYESQSSHFILQWPKPHHILQ